MSNRTLKRIAFFLVLAIVLALPTFSKLGKSEAIIYNSSNDTSSTGSEGSSSGVSSEDTETILHEDGLAIEDSDIRYYENGVPFTNGLKTVNVDDRDCTYFFDENGIALKNSWRDVDGNSYYFGEDGTAYIGGYAMVSDLYCKFDESGIATRKIDVNQKMVALTYDDGPANGTPIILETLKENNGVATFFVIGSRLTKETLRSYVKQAYDQDCEIGNHTYNHYILRKIPLSDVGPEVSQTQDIVKDIIGTEPVVFRPPGGATNEDISAKIGMPLIIWSLDTLDWKTKDSQKTIDAVLNDVSDGDVVLMHDLWDSTATASKTIIPKLTQMGYQLVTVSELAACRGITLENGKKYGSLRPSE